MRQRIVSLTIVGVALGASAVAWGHGFGPGGFRGRGGRPGDRGGVHGGAVLQRLLFPCRTGCFDAADTCVEAAESAAESCAGESCASQITAARTACQADRTSDDCDSAISALRTCAETCLDTEATALASCRTTLSSCLDGCGAS